MLYIKTVKLNNFRCFKSKNLEFKPNVNILIGDNGCGKTSVVEGVSYLCLGKSFKSAKDKDVLSVNESYFNIISEIISDNEENKVVISYDGNNKRVKNGEVVCKTLSEYVGKYKLIAFSPDDLSIIKGGPSNRRRFIDLFISQCDNRYLKLLVEYKKILKFIVTNTEFDDTHSYDDAITDRLVSFNDLPISYDASGYPTYYNGKNYTWTKGKLTRIHRGSAGQYGSLYEYCNFTYDGYGRRTSKAYSYDSNPGSTSDYSYMYTTTYDYDTSGRLIHETCVEATTYIGGSTSTRDIT